MTTEITDVLLYNSIPGFLGGITLVCFNLLSGHYKNNKYLQKLLLELTGATITASIIPLLLDSLSGKTMFLISFILGICWATVVKIIRNKITNIVKAAIGGNI